MPLHTGGRARACRFRISSFWFCIPLRIRVWEDLDWRSVSKTRIGHDRGKSLTCHRVLTSAARRGRIVFKVGSGGIVSYANGKDDR